MYVMKVFRSTDFYSTQFSVMEWVEHIHQAWFNNEIILGHLTMTLSPVQVQIPTFSFHSR